MKKRNLKLLIILSLTMCLLIGIIYPLSPKLFTKDRQFVSDKLEITSTQVNQIIRPQSIKELQAIVAYATLPISIIGANYSQGGQTSYQNGIAINMSQLNTIVSFDEREKTITVQSGATWYDIQKYIDPYNLSVKSMQSYNNFSIGGSISINAHGRDIRYGSVINGIESIQMILANGDLVSASRTENADLFKAAIGGYGLLGIITQATIRLTENDVLERKIHECTIDNFKETFESLTAKDQSIVFYNADLLPKLYQRCFITSWHKTDKPVTDKTRLQQPYSAFYIINKALEMLLRRVPLAFTSRSFLERLKKIKNQSVIVWRNNEMSYSVRQLAIDYHFPSTMTLQEYFIPVEHAPIFAKKLTKILKKNWINVINVSIRYVPADTTSTMPYARKDSLAFVLYLNIFNNRWSINKSCKWTRKIIDEALKYDGTYYLPYIMCATKKQFKKAYPNYRDFLKIKKIYDPQNKFRNTLFQKYLRNER